MLTYILDTLRRILKTKGDCRLSQPAFRKAAKKLQSALISDARMILTEKHLENCSAAELANTAILVHTWTSLANVTIPRVLELAEENRAISVRKAIESILEAAEKALESKMRILAYREGPNGAIRERFSACCDVEGIARAASDMILAITMAAAEVAQQEPQGIRTENI